MSSDPRSDRFVEQALNDEVSRLRRDHLGALRSATARERAADERAAALEAQLRGADESRRRLEEALADVQRRVREAEEHGVRLRAELDDVYASRSWRLTRGLRSASERLRPGP